MGRDFVLAHVSDLHLGPMTLPPLALVNLKRTMGAINWQRSRRDVHDPVVAELTVHAAFASGADHVAISGDLCNLGLPREHEAAHLRLQSWGMPEAISVVPGNHDIYTRIGRDHGIERWRDYMSSCDAGRTLGGVERGFPYVRVLGGGNGAVALIGVNSAIETPPFRAHGRVGVEQLAALVTCLERTKGANLARVVMLHHPPLAVLGKSRKELLDAYSLEDVLRKAGAELVIYGHNHVVDFRTFECADGASIVAGMASGSAGVTRHGEPTARFALYRFGEGGGRPAVEVYGLDPVSREFSRRTSEEVIAKHR